MSCDDRTHDRPPRPVDQPTLAVSRRDFMQTLGLSAAVGAIAQSGEEARAALAEDGPQFIGPDEVRITMRINGAERAVDAEPSATLLDVLRLKLDLTGAKEICDRGSCGGCAVLLDGELINACMMLAIDAQDRDVLTIEGLARGDALHPLQESFVRHDALQCGYCTPGFIMAGKALLDANPKPTLTQIKKGLGGNICRCATYTNIFNAVLEASGQEPITDAKG